MTFELTARLIQAASCGIGELKRAGRQEEADALTATVTEVTVVLETPPEDDAALVEKARGGDYGAFEGLVKHHQGKTYALALGIVKNAAEAEEVVQDTFFSAFQHLDTFRGDARFTTWIYRVATNHALMKLRKKRPEAIGGVLELEAHLSPHASTDGTSPFDALSLWARRPDEALQDREVTAALEASLDLLGDEDRALLLARAIQEASHEDLAHQFNTTVPAIKSRLHRARLQLRQLLVFRSASHRLDGASMAKKRIACGVGQTVSWIDPRA